LLAVFALGCFAVLQWTGRAAKDPVPQSPGA
jgi:hypothetical protein